MKSGERSYMVRGHTYEEWREVIRMKSGERSYV